MLLNRIAKGNYKRKLEMLMNASDQIEDNDWWPTPRLVVNGYLFINSFLTGWRKAHLSYCLTEFVETSLNCLQLVMIFLICSLCCISFPGVYDALQKKYLKTLLFCVCEAVDGAMIEEYACKLWHIWFQFNHQNMMELGIRSWMNTHIGYCFMDDFYICFLLYGWMLYIT
jgi:hypothetical protein